MTRRDAVARMMSLVGRAAPRPRFLSEADRMMRRCRTPGVVGDAIRSGLPARVRGDAQQVAGRPGGCGPLGPDGPQFPGEREPLDRHPDQPPGGDVTGRVNLGRTR